MKDMKIKVLPHIDPQSMAALRVELKPFLQHRKHLPEKMEQALDLLETPQIKRAFKILRGEMDVSSLAFILFSCITARKTYSWASKKQLYQQIEAVERLDDEFGHLNGGAAREFLKRAKEYYQEGLEAAGTKSGRPVQSTRMERIRLVFFKDHIKSEFPNLGVADLHRVLSCFMSLAYPDKYETSETIRKQLEKMEKENWQTS